MKNTFKLLSIVAIILFNFNDAKALEYTLPSKTPSLIDKSIDKPLKQELIFFPLSFFANGFELGTEIKVQETKTIRISGGYFLSYNANMYNAFKNNPIEYDYWEGFRGEFQYRMYSRAYDAPDNFFLGIYGVFKSANISGEITETIYTGGFPQTKHERINSNASALSFGTVLGYRTRFYDVFSMDMFFGGGITPTSIGDVEVAHLSFLSPFRKSINLRMGLTLGLQI